MNRCVCRSDMSEACQSVVAVRPQQGTADIDRRLSLPIRYTSTTLVVIAIENLNDCQFGYFSLSLLSLRNRLPASIMCCMQDL